MKQSIAILVLMGALLAPLAIPHVYLAESDIKPLSRLKDVSAGTYHTVGLKDDGTVLSTGDNTFGQRNVKAWTDIVAVAAGDSHTVGLTREGRVLAAGINEYGQCDVDGWTDIIAASASDYTTLGLRKDGTVIAVGDNSFGQCDVGDWTGIIAISAGPWHSVGLRSDGTVVAAGDNEYHQGNLDRWTEIVGISAGDYHTVGLKSDGTAVAQGYNADGRCDVKLWENLVRVAAGGYHTVGLRRDGTVVAIGANPDGRCDVDGWTDIAEISAGRWHTVGVSTNGEAVAVGFNEDGQCDVQSWLEPAFAVPSASSALSVPATPPPVNLVTENSPAPTADMTPAVEDPVFESPLNGSYSNTFEVLSATEEGKTDAAYAGMIGQKQTTDSMITMTSESVGMMVFLEDSEVLNGLPLTLHDGVLNAGYTDAVSGIEASYTGTLSRKNGQVTISGEYRTAYPDADSGSRVEISGLWTAISTREAVSGDLDTAKAKADVTNEDLQGGWSGRAYFARIENLEQVDGFPQGEKEDLLSMIGMEFSMRASFEEEGLSLAMYEEGQSESLADRVPFSLKGGVLTATVDQDESTTRMSGVIFLKRTRLAMTGVVEIQLSPPNHEDVALTLVIKMDLTKEVTSMGVPSFKTNRTA